MDIDLTAPIEPGKSAAGLALGQSTHNLPTPVSLTEVFGAVRLEYPNVVVWVKDGVVDQIGVCKEYRGRLNGVIGIGSTIEDVERLIGSVTEDEEDNLVMCTLPGWCFETSEWQEHDLESNKNARITAIFVHRTKAGK